MVEPLAAAGLAGSLSPSGRLRTAPPDRSISLAVPGVGGGRGCRDRYLSDNPVDSGRRKEVNRLDAASCLRCRWLNCRIGYLSNVRYSGPMSTVVVSPPSTASVCPVM